MTDIDLLIRRDSHSPKCRNCKMFTRVPESDAIGTCALIRFTVPDLAVCSAWSRAEDPEIEVRRVGAAKGGDDA